jgi:hypothetical protein
VTASHTSNGINGSSQITSNGAHIQEDIPIAIVGMALRLPGGIGTEEDLWDTLINKKDQRQRVPADRWNVDAFYSKTNKRGSVKTEHGYFLADEDLRQFDTSFFSITRNELEKLDPSIVSSLKSPESVWRMLVSSTGAAKTSVAMLECSEKTGLICMRRTAKISASIGSQVLEILCWPIVSSTSTISRVPGEICNFDP